MKTDRYWIEQQDNLEFMKLIPDNKIDLIYCDILYGTGRKFSDYQDLKPKKEIIDEFYIPRIKEMKRVLKDTGSIYLQMDTAIPHWIRCIMDDIFGYENFLNELIWCYKSGGASNKYFSKKHDIILLYKKSKKYIFNLSKEKSYTMKGGNKNVIYYQDERGYYTIVNMKDWFNDIGILSTASNERNGYQTQKPKALIERIIKASSNENDIVADFFMGSGTTCEVSLELGRRFIGCDINPRAIEITHERIKKYDKI